jgi:glycosyltransferase involved in cell wall biosynthesis
VIHVVTGASTAIGCFSLLLGRAKRIPASISFFGTELFEDGGATQRVLQPFALRVATSISVNSPHTGGYIPSIFKRKTHILLGGAVASESTDVPTHRIAGGPVLFVGRLVGRKGGDDLITAFRAVKDRIPGSKLVFVGDGPDRERLHRMVKELNLSSDVEFRGTLTGKPLHDAYEESSVVVLPSKYVPEDSQIEGLGLTLIEGSMHAKPLVGTRHGGIPEIVKDGVNGLLVPENNPGMLAEALIRILSDQELADRLGNNALEIAMRKFSWRAATDRLLESYS